MPPLTSLPVEQLQHLALDLWDPPDMLALSSCCTALAVAVRQLWPWKEHLNRKRVYADELRLLGTDDDAGVGLESSQRQDKEWLAFARLAIDLHDVQITLMTGSMEGQRSYQSEEFFIKSLAVITTCIGGWLSTRRL